MAIDFIIGSLLLLAVLVNVLALCAFRITPSLQTRSNSFVINLLIINVISCVILGIFLVLNSCRVTATPQNGDEQRRYFLDVVAALGALSLTLVICDTHSAITDPLRYHSRLSTLKVWLMIAGVWLVGVVFGVGSFFRGGNSFVFTGVFCALVVAAPFCLICAMYWRIFREARQNGLRMRKNGSSPLLQSSLNLVQSQQQVVVRPWDSHRPTIETILEKSPSVSVYGEGLTLKMDKVASSSLLELRENKIITDDETENKSSSTTQSQFRSLANLSVARNENLRQMFLFGVVPVETAAETESAEAAASRANECLLNQLNRLQPKTPEVRQVRSTPDLQSYLNSDDGLKVTAGAGDEVGGGGGNGGRGSEKTSLSDYRSMATSQTPPKHLSYMTSIRHRLSNASSLFKYREESRAARISILVVIMFLVSYIPYGLLLVAGDKGFLSRYTETVLSIFFVVLANIGSPIIFAYRNKRVRRAVKRLLHLETTEELLPSSFCSSNSRRIYRQKTISTYKRNLVLKASSGRKMQKLLLNCEAPQLVKMPQLPHLPHPLPPQIKEEKNGYENYFTESLDAKTIIGQKRNSTTSTASTIPCDEVRIDDDDVGGYEKTTTMSLLNRLGFIRRESRKMQKFGVSV